MASYGVLCALCGVLLSLETDGDDDGLGANFCNVLAFIIGHDEQCVGVFTVLIHNEANCMMMMMM